MRWCQSGARLSLKQYAKDGDSVKKGRSALAKEMATNEGCAMAQPNESATNRREGLSMGQPENRRRVVTWRSQKNRRRIVARGARNRGQKNRQIVARAKEYRRQIVAMAQPKEFATNCREGRAQSGPTESTKRREGRKNLRYKSSLGARAMAAKRIYDINRR